MKIFLNLKIKSNPDVEVTEEGKEEEDKKKEKGKDKKRGEEEDPLPISPNIPVGAAEFCPTNDGYLH